MLELIETYHVEVVGAVPTMLIALIGHPDSQHVTSRRSPPSARVARWCQRDLVRTLEDSLGATFIIVYGQTEMSPILTMTRTDDSRDDRGSTVGRPMAQWEVKVVDALSGEVVASGVDGEIYRSTGTAT